VLLPSHALHDLRERGAVLALQHGHHLRRLAAWACGGISGTGADFLAVGAFLAVVAFLPAFPLAGAPWAARAPPLAGRAAWALAGGAGCASAPSP
jgi:hypothetical protein